MTTSDLWKRLAIFAIRRWLDACRREGLYTWQIQENGERFIKTTVRYKLNQYRQEDTKKYFNQSR